MTTWFGTCYPNSLSGLRLKDNGYAAIDDERILFAVSEERLSGHKHDHRNTQSELAAVEHVGETGILAYSSCADNPTARRSGDLVVPSHHLSHALVAQAMSSFDEGICMIADAGGSVLSEFDPAYAWWAQRREQTTVWLFRRGIPELLFREQDGPYDIGPGEWYRAITHYLGWESHTLSGNTMALAGFGGDQLLECAPLWQEASGTFGGRLKNDPPRPHMMVHSLLSILASELGVSVAVLHGNNMRASLARYLQHSLEVYLADISRRATNIARTSNITLGGGVALNCVAAAKLDQIQGYSVYVSPVPGDVGQPLGNALWARGVEAGIQDKIPEDVFLGPRRDLIREADEAADSPRASSSRVLEFLAERLAAGDIVALCHGRSEYGARALGHRSVLCDPLNDNAVSRMKTGVKRREEFMPLAPIVLPGIVTEAELPFTHTMSLAPTIPIDYRDEFGAAVHVDGTARLQVAFPSSIAEIILLHFHEITGRRVLINTSFNSRGAPIVESGSDALRAFQELDIDYLLIGGKALYAK